MPGMSGWKRELFAAATATVEVFTGLTANAHRSPPPVRVPVAVDPLVLTQRFVLTLSCAGAVMLWMKHPNITMVSSFGIGGRLLMSTSTCDPKKKLFMHCVLEAYTLTGLDLVLIVIALTAPV